MVNLTTVRASNALIPTTLPVGIVAVFAGATNGIGETTLKAFARHTKGLQPRVYFLGRSTEAGERIAIECKALNAGGSFDFISADLSLLRNVDAVCEQIKAKEDVVNLLFLSQGTLVYDKDTSEGLNLALALAHYGRTRFITNLLPQLQRAASLKRVITVFTGCKEGQLDISDLSRSNFGTNFLAARAHGSTLVTLTLEALAKQAPGVCFVHAFPGFVKSGIARGTTGFVMAVMKVATSVLAPLLAVDVGESGERHLFAATNARFPAREGSADVRMVSLKGDGNEVAVGIDGKVGSGVYSIDWDAGSAGVKVVELLDGYRKQGVVEKVWEHYEGVIRRVLGDGGN